MYSTVQCTGHLFRGVLGEHCRGQEDDVLGLEEVSHHAQGAGVGHDVQEESGETGENGSGRRGYL